MKLVSIVVEISSGFGGSTLRRRRQRAEYPAEWSRDVKRP